MKLSKNFATITASYLTSVSLSLTTWYAFLFFNRTTTGSNTISFTIIYASFLLPGALVNIYTGILADKYSKKRIMTVAEITAGIVTIIFALLFKIGFNSLWWISGYISLISILFSFFEVPLDASTRNIAGPERAGSLTSIIWFSRAITFLIGPILGERLSGNIDFLLLLNALSFFLSAILIQTTKYTEEKMVSATVKEQFITFFSYVKSNKIIGFLLATNLIVAIFYMPLFGALINNISNSFGFSNQKLAVIESSNWVGVSLMAVVISIGGSTKRYLKNLFNILTIEGVLLTVWTVPYFFNMNLTLSFMFLVAICAIDGIINTAQLLGALAYFQAEVPENVRGKLLGALRTVMKLTTPIGVLAYGMLLNHFHWTTMMFVSSFAITIIAFTFNRTKVFRNFVKKL